MAERKTRAEKQQEQATAAILTAMTRRAISGDTTAAKIVLDAQRGTAGTNTDIEDLTPLVELLKGE